MGKRIWIAFVAIFLVSGSVFAIKAPDYSQEIASLLSLVETEKDFQDAVCSRIADQNFDSLQKLRTNWITTFEHLGIK